MKIRTTENHVRCRMGVNRVNPRVQYTVLYVGLQSPRNRKKRQSVRYGTAVLYWTCQGQNLVASRLLPTVAAALAHSVVQVRVLG